jgi:hypothetical protein
MATALLRGSAFSVIALSLGACGGGHARVASQRAAILAAKTAGVAYGFAPVLYPSEAGTWACNDGMDHAADDDTVHSCSTAVTLHDHGSATVTFTETVRKGTHKWIFRIGRNGHVSLVLSAGVPVPDLFF